MDLFQTVVFDIFSKLFVPFRHVAIRIDVLDRVIENLNGSIPGGSPRSSSQAPSSLLHELLVVQYGGVSKDTLARSSLDCTTGEVVRGGLQKDPEREAPATWPSAIVPM